MCYSDILLRKIIPILILIQFTCNNFSFSLIFVSINNNRFTFWWWLVSALASINEVHQRQARLVTSEVGDRIWVQFPVRDIYLGM